MIEKLVTIDSYKIVDKINELTDVVNKLLQFREAFIPTVDKNKKLVFIYCEERPKEEKMKLVKVLRTAFEDEFFSDGGTTETGYQKEAEATVKKVEKVIDDSCKPCLGIIKLKANLREML